VYSHGYCSHIILNVLIFMFDFIDQMDVSVEGRTYVQRYQVNEFPHVAIIDPRTGRLLWRKEGWTQQNPLRAETFAEMVMDFCSRNSFDRPPQAPKGPPRGAAAAAVSRPVKRSVQDMTEDEQLQEAMRASMEDASSPRPSQDSSDDDNGSVEEVEVVMDDSNDDDAVLVVDNDKKPAAQTVVKPPSLMDELLDMPVDDEPSGGARIQFRMLDGKRVVRTFATTDVVKKVYAFVAVSDMDCESSYFFVYIIVLFFVSQRTIAEDVRNGREFVLMAGYPPNDLINDIDKTVDECKLAGQAITVRWKS
jgi:UBX domain-containing protein 7